MGGPQVSVECSSQSHPLSKPTSKQVHGAPKVFLDTVFDPNPYDDNPPTMPNSPLRRSWVCAALDEDSDKGLGHSSYSHGSDGRSDSLWSSKVKRWN
jgi:hypothetical protein